MKATFLTPAEIAALSVLLDLPEDATRALIEAEADRRCGRCSITLRFHMGAGHDFIDLRDHN